jgi:hypothetical protein
MAMGIITGIELPAFKIQKESFIKEIKSKKRPFKFIIHPNTLMDLLDREIGFSSVKIGVQLNFNDHIYNIYHNYCDVIRRIET